MAVRIFHWLSRVLLAGVFLYSGWVKVRAPLQFAAAISGYQIVPTRLILPLADYLPWVEIALGVLVLAGWKLRWVAAGAAALLGIFIVVQTSTYLRGIEADCGCFGFGERISPLTIARDGLLLLPALFLALQRSPASSTASSSRK